MRRFRFALSGLEKVRQARVDQARLALARSEAEKGVEEERIMGLEREIEATTTTSARDGILDITGLIDEQRYISELRRQRESALQRLSQWIDAVEEDRQRLLHVRKEKKALERLRERRYLEFVREVMREEGQALDEAGTVGHWREQRKEA